MPTFHLHIQGRVQGVGFRPAVASLAEARGLHGTVSNGKDGVHIYLHTCETNAKEFADWVLTHLPPNAIVTNYHLAECTHQAVPTIHHPSSANTNTGFTIIESNYSRQTDLLLTPDIGLCPECRAELTDRHNRRNGYAFTTCLHCGPRYSISTALPYDRVNTTMAAMPMCPHCRQEYTDIHNRRHFSQTNSCPECAIPMHWYPARGQESLLTHPGNPAPDKNGSPAEIPLSNNVREQQHAVLQQVANALLAGQIIAVKGIGGYLLLCDATREESVQTLRRRKHRPHKPFAVMYPNLATARQDMVISEAEAEALLSPVAPIVLCRKRPPQGSPTNADDPTTHSSEGFPSPEKQRPGLQYGIHSGLHRIGLMLPYTPLLALIAELVNRPLIATSGNISGSPILYRDEEACELLWEVADGILSYERDIVTPQDDSVWQFTKGGERIILRRSRGMAPDYFPHSLGSTNETLFAAGADLKSAFAIHHRNNIYISQYLGDLEDYRAQESWNHTRQHLLQLIEAKPAIVLTDLHPGYFSGQEAMAISEAWHAQLIGVPHHEAHIAAVLAENSLCPDESPILGIAWDGTGFGTDGHAWGSETFIVADGQMERALHLDYFQQLMGDKMSREPRLSALSLLHGHQDALKVLQDNFSDAEWSFYQKMVQQPNQPITSSMGRLIDGVASILGLCQYNSYEGQAAMELEAMAAKAGTDSGGLYPFLIREDKIDWQPMLQALFGDLESGQPRHIIAKRFFTSLAQLVIDISHHLQIPRIALSGGVFQNALLIDLIRQRLPENITLYTHQQLSPNDECIGLGQLAWYHFFSRGLSLQAKPGITLQESLDHPSSIIHHLSSTPCV